MDYREWDQVPDLDLVQSPERRDLDYTDIQGGNRIGMGGHADVSRVTVGGTTLVVKEPRLQGTVSKDTYEAFLDEAETWAALDDHKNVVGVIDWDAERVPWIAMEYMDGESLRERVNNGRIETREALWIGVCLSRAIQHAHRHGVAHLDLKPENVLFRKTPDGIWDMPKVADWGLSSYLIKHSGTVEGLTPNYAAPEQFDADKYGSPDDFTDRYQLAALLYEALTGQ
jgi:serine/threonine protein kinase